MGRFYQTDKPVFVEDFVYNPNIELAGKLLLEKERQFKEQEAMADAIYNINFNYLNSDAEKANADRTKKYFQDSADNIIKLMQADPMNFQKYQNDLKKLQREFTHSKTAGDIAKMEGSYNAYNNMMKEIDEQCKKSPEICARLKAERWNNWGGNSFVKEFQGGRLTKDIDMKDVASKIDKLKADKISRSGVGLTKDGRFISETDSHTEFLTEADIEKVVIGHITENPENIARLRQMEELGYGTYINPDGTFSKQFYKEFVDPYKAYAYQRTTRNHNWKTNQFKLEEEKANRKKAEEEAERQRNTFTTKSGTTLLTEEEVVKKGQSVISELLDLNNPKTQATYKAGYKNYLSRQGGAERFTKGLVLSVDTSDNSQAIREKVNKYINDGNVLNIAEGAKLGLNAQDVQRINSTIPSKQNYIDQVQGGLKNSWYEFGQGGISEKMIKDWRGTGWQIDGFDDEANRLVKSVMRSEDSKIDISESFVYGKKDLETVGNFAQAALSDRSGNTSIFVGKGTVYDADGKLREMGPNSDIEVDTGFWSFNQKFQDVVKSNPQALEALIKSGKVKTSLHNNIDKRTGAITVYLPKDVALKTYGLDKFDGGYVPDEIPLTMVTNAVKEVETIHNMTNNTELNKILRDYNMQDAVTQLYKKIKRDKNEISNAWHSDEQPIYVNGNRSLILDGEELDGGKYLVYIKQAQTDANGNVIYKDGEPVYKKVRSVISDNVEKPVASILTGQNFETEQK